MAYLFQTLCCLLAVLTRISAGRVRTIPQVPLVARPPSDVLAPSRHSGGRVGIGTSSGSRAGVASVALSTPSSLPSGGRVGIGTSSGSRAGVASAAFPTASSLPTRANSRITMFGVKKEIIKEGDGKNIAKAGDRVTMHYKGTFGPWPFVTQFDSSYDAGEPFVFELGAKKVIKGWDQGIPGMSLGEKAVLQISSDLAYGERGALPDIPPNTDLTFEVELLKIEPGWPFPFR